MINITTLSIVCLLFANSICQGSSPSEGLPSFRKLIGSYRGKSSQELKAIAGETLADCQQLDISHSDITNQQLEVIASSMNLTQLTELNLSYCEVNGSYFNQLLNLRNLKTLIIRSKNLFSCDLDGLSPITSLCFLDLSECNISSTDFAETLRKVLGSSKIETLILEKLPVGCPLNLTHLTRNSGCWRKLKHLNISLSYVFPDSVTYMGIEHLEARGLHFANPTTSTDIFIIIEDYAPEIPSKNTSVSWAQRLVLQDRDLPQSNPCRHLDLSGNNLGNKDVNFLKHTTALQSLILSVNIDITQALLKRLDKLPLTHLDLSYTGVEDGFHLNEKSFIDVPLFFPVGLCSLNLSFTNFCGEHLQETLSRLPTLKNLLLTGNRLRPDAFKALYLMADKLTFDEQTQALIDQWHKKTRPSN